MLLALCLLLIPLTHKLEKWITKIMVEKNKKIRLDAAKKTIAKLEGLNYNENKDYLDGYGIQFRICPK